jgi:hypothetical protein
MEVLVGELLTAAFCKGMKKPLTSDTAENFIYNQPLAANRRRKRPIHVPHLSRNGDHRNESEASG